MFDVITIGDCTLDTILVIDNASLSCDLNKDHCKLCFNYADKIPIQHTTQSIGGNAANIAVGCKKLGLNTGIITELGDDINGIMIKHELEHAGVDTKLVKIIKNGETRYSVILNFEGERTILSYFVKRNYSLSKIPETKWVYYTSLGKSFEHIQPKLVAFLKKNKHIRLACNPGSYQKNDGHAVYKKILPYTDLLFVNRQEAENFVGEKDSIPGLLRSLHSTGVKMIVLTDGTNGSYTFDGTSMYQMLTFNIPAIARTGAGDAYASGFLSAIIYNKTMPEAMQWGTANASGVIQKFGAQNGLLGKQSISRLITQFKATHPIAL